MDNDLNVAKQEIAQLFVVETRAFEVFAIL